MRISDWRSDVCSSDLAPEAPAASPAPQQGQAGEGVAQATPLDTISVTATRNPIETFEYPGMVTVIGPQELQTLQPSSPDDILRFVPNVEFLGGPRRKIGRAHVLTSVTNAHVVCRLRLEK